MKHVQSGSVAIPTPQEKPGSKTNPIETKPSRRLFENRIPDHLPIKVKIKREKEKRFRDLENQNWVRDLELEVKNVGEKPIYFLFFYVVIPDAKIGDKPQGLSIVYGRAALSDLNNEPTADDVPINPGETKVLMIEDAGLKSWDDQITRRLLPARVRGARLIIQDLIFGDGTGFKSTGGVPVKRDKKPSGGAHFRLMDRYGGVRVAAVTGVSTIEDEKKPRCAGMFQPASFLSAGADFKLGAIARSQPECNCANESCWYGNERTIHSDTTNEFCYQCGDFKHFAAAQCFNPATAGL
ncbi:MAG TPA: hypothetical protein VJS17_05115 [Pyrinomonadaceae bacterium]|nr:hypothetical protein [Pyrinomonadaceae bacterium]